MASHGPTKGSSVTEMLYSLCSLYAKDQGKLSSLYRHSLNILGSHITPSELADEFRLSTKIQKRLVQQRRERDAVTFVELHQRLTNQSSLLLNATGLSSGVLPLGPSPSLHQTNIAPAENQYSGASASRTLVGSSGISSMGSGELSSLRGSHSSLTTPLPQFYSTPATGDPTYRPHPPAVAAGKPREAWSEIKKDSLTHHNNRVLPSRSKLTHELKLTREESEEATRSEVSEAVLLRDIIFVFQGIEGEVLRYDIKQEAYRIDEKVSVAPSVRELCHKLAELGWIYRRVRNFIDSKSRDKNLGLVCQSFCAALSQELVEYYRLIAVLEAQQQQVWRGEGGGGTLSLRRLVVWTHDPLQRLKVLGTLVDGCKRLKGGALVSALYAYSQHGDPYVSSLVKHLLNQVYRPVNATLLSWIFDGELFDKSLEFFIACDESAKEDKLWRSKYSLRRGMLPSFIPEDLADKILIIGKSINFLRQSCKDHTQLGGGALRTWYIPDQGEPTFDSMTGAALHTAVATAYQETSKHLLYVLNTKYNFMEHLKALRRYLLLGQGDFIRHLMDLLAPELGKPATSLYLHNLTGTLETAVRATNAQFEATDILNRLDVRLLDLSPGDQGWDVFSLHYHVDGPISTVFTPETMLQYLRVFNFLWRSKRMEYCLANMWRGQTSYYRSLQTIPELRPVLHQCHLLISAMVHFISQLQYYVTFEVMECCWAGLVKKVTGAEDLGQVIAAHDGFLEQITAQCLLDPHSQPMLTRLRAIFDLIIMFQQKQAAMISKCLGEVERREAVEERGERRGREGQWGTTTRATDAEIGRRREFLESDISAFRSEFIVLQESFKDMVEEFMAKLTSHPEQSLRFLCFRLDFNEFYSSTGRFSASPRAKKTK